LDISKITVTGNIIENAATPGPISGRRYVNMQPDYIRTIGSVYQHLPIPGKPSDNMLGAKLLAETNPSRPVIDLPIAVYELREIPQLLKKEGDDIIRRGASLNLKYQFGIKPLVNDLVTLLNFSDEVAKRDKELAALQRSGLRRKRNLYQGENQGQTLRTVHSTDKFNIDVLSDVTTSTKIWGFTVWKSENPGLMAGDRRALARKAVLGLTVDFSTAWNAIPWSWLVDWCSNVGDILVATRNTVGAVHGPVWIMEKVDSFAKTSYPDDPYVSEGTWTIDTKLRRRVYNVSVDSHLPILNGRQLSILGSIGVTRRMPRSS
jgi:hypothetical protein